MELLIAAAVAAGILASIALLSPGVERRRTPLHTAVGRDQHTQRLQRASFAAQVAQRNAPRPLRVSGPTVQSAETPAVAAPRMTPGAAPAAAGFLASAQTEGPSGPLLLPPPPAIAPRLDWARQTSDSLSRNQRERNADGLVASLLGPTARAS